MEWLGWKGPLRSQKHGMVALEGSLKIIHFHCLPWDGCSPTTPGCPWAHPALPGTSFSSCQDTFQDYQEMFIQFGYVVLFSSAFPLAAMCALVNNIIEIRSDAFKLCTGLQRPFGQRVESIGQWQVGWGLQGGPAWPQGSRLSPVLRLLQKVMEAMGVLAIVVNCYLIAQCGQLQRLFPWLSPEGAIISVVVLEVGRHQCRVSRLGRRHWGAQRSPRVPAALRPAAEVRHPSGHP